MIAEQPDAGQSPALLLRRSHDHVANPAQEFFSDFMPSTIILGHDLQRVQILTVRPDLGRIEVNGLVMKLETYQSRLSVAAN